MITISFFNLLNQNYFYFKKLFDISRKLDLDPTLTTYGGDNAASNSGILRFVRIEFAGKKVKWAESC